MKLKPDFRETSFNEGRALSPRLGDIFQNPMDLTKEDLLRELTIVKQEEVNIRARLYAYEGMIKVLIDRPEVLAEYIEP